jgi:hypothetical protein
LTEHHSPGLITSYLAGEDKLAKKFPANRIKHLISINVDIERPDDGNVDRIRPMYAKTRAKISCGCGLVAPY